ncbi:MAG: hypothetical protein HN930_02010, partial [Pelagibacterales bacterium]|nr:hypothetical protein [Pelagibacterales bacterium]
NWHLCASHEMIEENNASIELINVHINSLSTVSILPGKLGQKTRILNKKYIDLWEEKLLLLLSLAPKRVDQAIPIISFYLNTGEDEGIVRICDYLSKGIYYQGFCDLALGAIYLKEGNFSDGIYLIKRANTNGVLDSKNVDKDTTKYLKSIISKYD